MATWTLHPKNDRDGVARYGHYWHTMKMFFRPHGDSGLWACEEHRDTPARWVRNELVCPVCPLGHQAME